MKRAALATTLAVACSSPSALPPEATRKVAPTNRAPASETANLARIADDALNTAWALDFELPMADKPRERTRIANLLIDACKAGDRPACWKALGVAPSEADSAIGKLVEANCMAGDKLSCRALPAIPLDSYPSAPGAAGRSDICDDYESTKCDLTALRAECTAGFQRSCINLMLRSPNEEKGPLLDRAFELSREGCDAWILDECIKVAQHDGDPRQELALQRWCVFGGCEAYGYFLKQSDPQKARDLIERSCQHKQVDITCLDLAVDYLEDRLPEPTRGRGQALLNWTCALIDSRLPKQMTLLERYPDCKRASK